jgi:predicted nucleic acid-binding protein
MPKPRAYIETTVPNFYYDFRPSADVVAHRAATRRWWAGAAERYDLVTSGIVLQELAAGSSARVPLRLGLLADVPALAYFPRVTEIVATYLKHKLMPATPPEDAWHLALASYHSCDLIVTWNCRHLANPNKATHIRRINSLLGLNTPRIVTPLELLTEES